MKEFQIEGLTIDEIEKKNTLKQNGIVALERKGFKIHRFVLKNVSVKNVGHSGIHTQASNNYFYNIYTENCGMHGLGITNDRNPNQENYFYLDGHLSVNDSGYGIDFSGYKDKNNIAYSEYPWRGEVSNVRVLNSQYGIKTAGYWDLKLNNIYIDGSTLNGFFICVDAPGKKIIVDNLEVRNTENYGLALFKNTSFEGRNIKIINCKKSLQVQDARVQIDTLLIQSDYANTYGTVINNNTTLSNFTVTGNSKEVTYPIWVMGKNVVLKNGKIFNNEGTYGLLLHKNADDIIIENVIFYDDREIKRQTKGILSLSEGRIKIKECEVQGNKKYRDLINIHKQ